MPARASRRIGRIRSPRPWTPSSRRRSSTSRTSASASTASGAQRADVHRRRRRAPLRHRAQRRRQDHDDGRDHRQDAARRRATVFFGQTIDLTRPRRGRDRAPPASAASSRSRRVFEQHTVFENLETRDRKADKRCRGRRCSSRSNRAAARPHRCVLETIGLAPTAKQPGRTLVARPEAVAGDRHAAGEEPEAAAARRARRGHDRLRRRSARAELIQSTRRRPHAWWSSSTTWISCAVSPIAVSVLHEGQLLAEGLDGAGAERPARNRGLPRRADAGCVRRC